MDCSVVSCGLSADEQGHHSSADVIAVAISMMEVSEGCGVRRRI